MGATSLFDIGLWSEKAHGIAIAVEGLFPGSGLSVNVMPPRSTADPCHNRTSVESADARSS